MRSKPLNITVRSDVDLSQLTSKRVSINQEGDNIYRITSTLKFWSCERHSFVWRYLNRKKPAMTFFTGNCSCPTGYYWGPLERTPSDFPLTTKLVTSLRSMKERNDHGGAYEQAAVALGFDELALKFRSLNQLHENKGYLSLSLSYKRYELYTALLEGAKKRLTPDQFQTFYMCF